MDSNTLNPWVQRNPLLLRHFFRRMDVFPPFYALAMTGAEAVKPTIPPGHDVKLPFVPGLLSFQEALLNWYLRDPPGFFQAMYNRRGMVDRDHVQEYFKFKLLEAAGWMGVMVTARVITDAKYGKDPIDLIAARVNSTADYLLAELHPRRLAGALDSAASKSGATVLPVTTSASLVAEKAAPLLFFDPSRGWNRFVSDFSSTLFSMLAFSVVAVSISTFREIRKPSEKRTYFGVPRFYINNLFHIFGYALGGSTFQGLLRLFIPWSWVALLIGFLPRMFIAGAVARSMAAFAGRYITFTESEQITLVQEQPQPNNGAETNGHGHAHNAQGI